MREKISAIIFNVSIRDKVTNNRTLNARVCSRNDNTMTTLYTCELCAHDGIRQSDPLIRELAHTCMLILSD